MEPENVRHAAPAPSPKGNGLPRRELDPAARAQLDEALRAGDHRRAIALLDALFGDGLFRFIVALVGREDAADDLYQITLLAAFRDLGSFEARSSIRTWLFGIARHRCLDALKAAKRRDGRFSSMAALPETADDAPGAPDRLDDAEVRAALQRCLDELPADARMVLLLRFSEGMPYEDIARVCRSSAEAVRARVSRALPLLRRCVERKGVL
ncbi:MAG: RNA polymerase sigma factor [Kofleriaceae bacterium]